MCFFVISLSADLLLLPMCRLNFRFRKIHRKLCKLTARAVQSMLGPPSELTGLECAEKSELDELYHIVWLLRRQLNYPQLQLENSATTIFDLELSYENLIRMHFWLGPLVLPTIVFDRLHSSPSILL